METSDIHSVGQGGTYDVSHILDANRLYYVEADIHGIAYGQRIIDGKVPGLGLE
ncbi:MAG TPA: hypothetical protein VJL88_08800 [Nitrospira sp.]|nr:hypothetical protein [Nitrospira sp.]